MSKELRIVKRGSCPSLSGKSTLKYEFARTEDGKELFARVSANSGGGYWSNELLSLTNIENALRKAPDSITSILLNPLLRGKSVNTSAFILAALKHEGLVKPIKGKTRVHQLADDYKERIADLLTSDLKARPKTTRKKAAVKKKRTPARAKSR